MIRIGGAARRGPILGVMLLMAAGVLAWRLAGPSDRPAPSPPPSGRDAFRAGDVDEALRLANRALARRPDDRDAWDLREAAIARLVRPEVPPRADPGSPLDAARAHLRLGEHEPAREALRRALDPGPDPEASWLLSRAFLQAGDWASAGSARRDALGFGDEDPTAPEPAPYVGSDRCEACHQDRHRQQRGSRHGRTLRTGAELDAIALPEGTAPDPGDPEVRHAFRRDKAGIRMETRVGERLRDALIEYAVGSGNRGLTFLGRDAEGTMRMSRLTLYRGGTVLAASPMAPLRLGDEADYLGRPFGLGQLAACLDCHATTLVEEPGRGAPRTIERGIGCERCHGPGGHHLRAIEGHFPDLAIARPRLASAAQILRLCGQCHSPPASEEISPADPTGVRQQAVTLARSRCYSESQGRLSCVTCHDPHRDAETSPAYYEDKCLSCHRGEARPSAARRGPAADGPMRRVACPVEPARGCLECHMPAVEVFSEHATYADHHIRIHSESADPRGR